MQDSKTLHFLKQFPAWLVLTFVFLIVLWLYLRTADQFLQRVIDTVLGALLGVLTNWRNPSQSANTVTGDVFVPQNLNAEENNGVETLEEK
jgi:hypothetical protein